MRSALNESIYWPDHPLSHDNRISKVGRIRAELYDRIGATGIRCVGCGAHIVWQVNGARPVPNPIIPIPINGDLAEPDSSEWVPACFTCSRLASGLAWDRQPACERAVGGEPGRSVDTDLAHSQSPVGATAPTGGTGGQTDRLADGSGWLGDAQVLSGMMRQSIAATGTRNRLVKLASAVDRKHPERIAALLYLRDLRRPTIEQLSALAEAAGLDQCEVDKWVAAAPKAIRRTR